MGKKIPTKNYVILAAAVLITIIGVFYARSWYITTKEYNLKNSTLLTVVNEIKTPEELTNYTFENPKFVLYVASGQNQDIKTFEKKFKKLITSKELQENILYLNSDNINIGEFNDKLKELSIDNKVKDKINNDSVISIYVFDNSKLTHILVNAEKLTTDQINVLFKKYGVIDNA